MSCIGLNRKRASTVPGSNMPRFGGASTSKAGWATFRRLVEFTTMVSPTLGAFHTNRAKKNLESNHDDDKGIKVSFSTDSSFDLPPLMDPVKHHLERVYIDLRGREPDLSRERLEEFLRDVQGATIIEPPLELERYTAEQFLEVWYMYYRLATRPIKAEQKDLTKPISNYFISSSHNTYLWGNQLYGENTAEAYRTVLKNDGRCIEIDVWNGAGTGKEEAPGAKTPSQSKSPNDHRRHLSSSSLPGPTHSLTHTNHKSYELSRSSKTSGPSSSQPVLGLGLDLKLPAARVSATCVDRLGVLGVDDFIGEPLSRARSLGQVWTESQEQAQGILRSKSSLLRRTEPQVMHAHTLAKTDISLHQPISFREVCQAIKETAFVTNELPIIVSLEVHATGEQQDMVATIMKEEWGDYLLDTPFDECDPNQRQPRLEELKRKILVKVKKAPAIGSLSPGSTQLLVPTPSIHEDEASGSDDDRGSEDHALPKKTLIREALGKLGIYTHSEHYKDFKAAGAKTLSHIFSIDEDKILKLHQTNHKELFLHNRNFFMRAYPHKRRIDSSNLDPSIYWRKGIQMVALNWQSWDEAMMLNSAMFESEKGWVLKPPGYRTGDTETSQAEVSQNRTLDLKIIILAGQHLPTSAESNDSSGITSDGSSDSGGSSLRPFVKCELHVERPEERAEKKTIKDGFAQEGMFKRVTKTSESEHPDWGLVGHALDFSLISNVVEELSFVRFKIEMEGFLGDDLVACACIRLDRLQQGYRFINLMDMRGKPIDGQLLVKIEKSFR